MREISAVVTGIYGQRRGENLGRKKKNSSGFSGKWDGDFSSRLRKRNTFSKSKIKKRKEREIQRAGYGLQKRELQ